ncbi:MAG: hypothetical protein MPK11_05780 [Gammaproteobacteria bacterium]|nr:hypothetical protein [Gammaproteobacteria bacterium]MDA7960982.1 hypothetical protein [Gammaproteobacteria bacterium]MDA7970265.1 hypothetical protein [Gammaproteobacteria bacterium]MDA7971912.1 hypothetical protein [Gammaproteobacteria bacterium]MDA8024010.1 hypothetical protein [Gammaproteobacteria bacterium]
MQWLLLGVIVVALLFMSSWYPRTAFAVLGALAVAAAAVIFTTRDDALFSRWQLPVGDIRIENAVITRAYGDSYQFNARLANTHASILLKESVLSITMLDCPHDSGDESGDANCAVIGQSDLRINTKIPAGQSRDISKNVVFPDARPAGAVRWKYQIIETRN